MKKTTKKRFKMAVVRGSQPRMAEMFFYSNFKSMDIDFMGDKKTGWVVDKKIPKNINYYDLKTKPVWGIDPVKLLLGKGHEHRAWTHLTDLESTIKNCDVINVSDAFYFYCGQCADLAKKHNKKLVVITWETVLNHPSTYLPPYSFNVKKVLAEADLFIARSFMAEKYLLSIGVPQKKIKVVYKGIDLSNFKPTTKPRVGGVTRLLYVGQLVASKGVNELLEAFKLLSVEFPKLELWICAKRNGEPKMEAKIKEISKHFPLKWWSDIEYDQISDKYSQCDIYCQFSKNWKYFGLLPGGNEWFSYSIMEAMASGLPVVATNVGGIPEEIGDYNIQVEEGNVEAAYQGIKSLIVDRQKRLEIGKRNIERAKRLFDIKVQAKKTEEAILTILK